MPYWNLYLQDQGFNIKNRYLSSIAIITRFLRHLFGGGLQINQVKGCFWFELQLDGSLHLVCDFYYSNSFQSVALLS